MLILSTNNRNHKNLDIQVSKLIKIIKIYKRITKSQMQNNEVQQPKLEFKEYPSIQLSTRDKFIQLIQEEGFDKPDLLWVASEKIHGSNFSIHYSGKDKIARYGRRTDFLSKEIPVPCENPGQYFTQTFYDARNTVKKFHNNLSPVFQKIKEKYPETEIIQIYGQFFGGAWPQNQANFVKGPKAVQKGVYYTPHHEFMVFDIKVTTSTSIFWVQVTDIAGFVDGNFMHVPIYAKGTFDQMLAVQTVIDSTIPQLLGFQKLQKNIIQGMVLRPNRNLTNKYQQRVILKKKNQEFMQKASAPKAVVNKQKNNAPIDPELLPFLEKLNQYLNFNRIQSVTSKFPDVKDRNKIKIQVCKDVYSDAQKDEYKGPEDVELYKRVKAQFQKLVIKEINSYYIKH